MYLTTHYKINFDKVKTLDDIIRILKVLDIRFEPSVKNLHEIEDLIEEQEKDKFNTTLDTNTKH